MREASCHDEPTLRDLAVDPDGRQLSTVDAAIYIFAAKVATAPASVQQRDVNVLRALGLVDADIADIAYAVGVRLFFATVLDALGAQPDPEMLGVFDQELLRFVRVAADLLEQGS